MGGNAAQLQKMLACHDRNDAGQMQSVHNQWFCWDIIAHLKNQKIAGSPHQAWSAPDSMLPETYVHLRGDKQQHLHQDGLDRAGQFLQRLVDSATLVEHAGFRHQEQLGIQVVRDSCHITNL